MIGIYKICNCGSNDLYELVQDHSGNISKVFVYCKKCKQIFSDIYKVEYEGRLFSEKEGIKEIQTQLQIIDYDFTNKKNISEETQEFYINQKKELENILKEIEKNK